MGVSGSTRESLTLKNLLRPNSEEEAIFTRQLAARPWSLQRG
jgi:hypothetical protein